MDIEFAYKEYALDSRKRDFGTIDSPGFIVQPMDSLRLKLKSASIPISWYATNTYNNQLLFSEDGSTQTQILIKEGDYTGATMATALQSLLTAASPGGHSYAVAFDSINGRLTVTGASAFTIYCKSTAGYSLGMSDYQDLTANGSFVAEFPYRVDLSGPQMISLQCPNVKSNSFQHGTARGILCSIPVGHSSGGFITYDNQSADYFEADPGGINTLSFAILDSEGNTLSLNGKGFALSIGVLV